MGSHGVVSVPSAAGVLFGGFVLGEQGDQIGVGERQVVDDAGPPAGHCGRRGRRAVGEGEPVHLRGAALGAVGQEDSVPESADQRGRDSAAVSQVARRDSVAPSVPASQSSVSRWSSVRLVGART